MDSIKCVALGDGAAGKSYYYETFITDIFPGEYIPTVFENYTMDVLINDKRVKFGFWDTAGQEDYDRLRPLSYPNADVFLIFFSVVNPNSFVNIETKWVPEYQFHCPKVPFAMIGCQIDLREDKETLDRLAQQKMKPITKAMGKELAKKLGAFRYVECSSKTRFNMKAVLDAAIEAAINDQAKHNDSGILSLGGFKSYWTNLFAKPDISIKYLLNTKSKQNDINYSLKDNNSQVISHSNYSDDGRYEHNFVEILKIGWGGFGSVFKAKNSLDEQEYAIKKIEFQSNDERLKKYILNELKTMAKLQSDYVVHYKNSWIEYNNCIYIQMELCFDSLKNIIEIKPNVFNRKLNQTMNSIEYYFCCHVFKELLECVQYLHQLNPPLIHRDLKPANILITNNNTNQRFLKICDFGLTTVQNMESMEHTSRVGSIKYIAPEVTQSNKYDWRADIYSTGRIALELFEIDIEETKKLPRHNDTLDKSLNKLEEVITTMVLSPFWKRRPTCAEVLNTANDWFIDKNCVKSCENFESLLNDLNENENQFFFKYFFNKFYEN